MNKNSNVTKISLAIILDIYVFISGWFDLSTINLPYRLGKMLESTLRINFGLLEYDVLKPLFYTIIGLIAITLAFLSKGPNISNILIKVVRIASIILTLLMANEFFSTIITLYNIYIY